MSVDHVEQEEIPSSPPSVVGDSEYIKETITSQLMFSTPPKYGIFYITFMLTWITALVIGIFFAQYELSKAIHEIPATVISVICATFTISLLIFVLFRLPIRYQVWSDKFSVTTLDYFLPSLFKNIFSRGYTIHFSDIDRIVFYDSPNDSRRTACHTGFLVPTPNTWTSFVIPIKIYTSKRTFWKNFLLTPMFPRQLAAQLKRCLADYRIATGYVPQDQEGLVPNATYTNDSADELTDDEDEEAEATFAPK
ncbi:tryptophan-specific transport protein [Acrasis kona]|uniref:Tryptophan-specific transport protein n=1 Tax=Acrasis kona TaxID=1008807 RepID=A0AAW2ZB24_9EUKA